MGRLPRIYNKQQLFTFDNNSFKLQLHLSNRITNPKTCFPFSKKFYLFFAGATSPAEQVVDVLLERNKGAAALLAVHRLAHLERCVGSKGGELLQVWRLEIE